jgi:hypothetical protein
MYTNKQKKPFIPGTRLTPFGVICVVCLNLRDIRLQDGRWDFILLFKDPISIIVFLSVFGDKSLSEK